MAILELNDDKTSTLVHNYAVAGGDLKNHIRYFFYLIQSFDIHMIIIDNAGWEFISAANESEPFRKANIELKFFEFDTDKEGLEYEQAVAQAKREYSKDNWRICYKQFFNISFIRRGNEHLQACIDHHKVYFASRTQANDEVLTEQIGKGVLLEFTNEQSIMELVDTQDDLVFQTKKQCALIEVKTNPLGSQTFDLPTHLRRSNSVNRARKDNYTALLLGAWAVKGYNDLMAVKLDNITTSFIPRMVY
jgi:hypothetical protein